MNGLPIDFETESDFSLNKNLEIFYSEIRTNEGKHFSKSTFTCIRSGINRHLQNPPFKRVINIMHSPLFSSSNKMFTSVLKKMKMDGGDTTKHHKDITENDLKTLQSPNAFNIRNPKELQEKVFFNIMMCFARRGRENLRNLTKSSFVFKCDDTDTEFCEMAFNEQTKNHKDCEAQSKPRMYATGDTNCPVATLKFLLSKLSPKCEFIFTKPKKKCSI